MKIMFAGLLALLLLFGLTACAGDTVTPVPDNSQTERENEETDAGLPAETEADPADPGDGETGDDTANSDNTAESGGKTDIPAVVTKPLTEPDQPLEEIPGAEDADCGPLTDFGLELLGRAAGENPVLSPLSAYIALAMAAEGAAGETRTQLEALLGDDARAAASRVLAHLAADTENIFSCADSAWVGQDTTILPDYLDVLSRYYGAELYAAGFDIGPMNDWVKERTRGLIPVLFDQPLDPLTRLVLINTLYMKAKWAVPFDSYSTREGTFYGADREEAAQFMHRTGNMDLIRHEDYEGVILPYRGSGMCFAAIKPTRGTVRELLAGLDTLDFETENIRVALSLPKFALDYGTGLTDMLADMGCTAPFEPGAADFSGMSRAEELFISAVVQKVRIIVDEEGTEAAAATGALAGATAMPAEPYYLNFDEPFLYFVLDTETRAPLFAGICDMPMSE